MSDNGHYVYVGCRNLGMAVIADAFRIILNEQEDSIESEQFLMSSPIVELCLHEIGVDISDIPETIKRLKTNGVKTWGRTSLTDNESYQTHKKNMSDSWNNRKPETKKRKWWKNGHKRINSED